MILSIAAALALGALTWSLLEYCIHRWLGHDRRLRPNFFADEHVRHHSQGNYFAPTSKKAAAAVLTLLIAMVPAVALAGWPPGTAYALGLVGFYVFYEVLHRREHTHRGVGTYGRWARRHHFHHHFADPRTNHGVTSPLWDLVFRTYRRPGLIRVPRALAMTWLQDPETGELPRELSPFYEIRSL